MIKIGGELAHKDELNYFFTDSGRSSLRFFCRNFPKKKVLLPDFLCGVIVEVLDQEDIIYDFYHLNEDLSIDEKSLKKGFDVFYVVNYFGSRLDIPAEVDCEIVLEDNVFFPEFENINKFENWFGFNSYRKISTIADGSLVKTNLVVKDFRILEASPFSQIKYEAKEIKYDYLATELDDDSKYLERFEAGEAFLNRQSNIYNMSDRSLALLGTFLSTQQNENDRRRNNYNLLKSKLDNIALDLGVIDFYSFLVLKIKNRDEFRRRLASRQIYLPVHWPKSLRGHSLYDEVVSVPLFYSKLETEYLLEVILDELNI